jgi:AcrR family transcriptional regulator
MKRLHFILFWTTVTALLCHYLIAATMSLPDSPLSFDADAHPGQGQEGASTTSADADLPCGGKAAGRPRTADMEARLNSLVQTASCLFMEKGYGKVSLEMIAREAHVAVRTIYVKFGGKVGLFKAVIQDGRARYFTMGDMDTDPRPLREILDDFGMRFMVMITLPEMYRICRMVAAEAAQHPELASTFYEAGPGQTRELLRRFFARPDILAQFREDMTPELLTGHLLSCLIGDQMKRMLYDAPIASTNEPLEWQVAHGLAFFYRGALR